MAFIKNIEHETVLPLAEQVTVQPGQIVSRTLAMLWYRYWKEKENLQ